MQQIVLGSKIVSTQRPAFVMGIVNVTPDSFYSESRGGADRALELIDQGADIIDMGGESTRPGFFPVSDDDELERVIPVVKEIRKHSDIPISVDTRKLTVIKVLVDYGVDVWNDVSGLGESLGTEENLPGSGNLPGRVGKLPGGVEICLGGEKSPCGADTETGAASYDSSEQTYACQAADFILKSGISYILMHNKAGTLEDLNKFFEEKISFLLNHHVGENKIIIDPGIGFGKSNEESINIIKNTDKICGGKYPLLMALSRKRCIGQMTGRPLEERLAGTLAANMISVQKGAKIIRVHDLSPTIDCLNVMKYLQ